MTQKDGHLSPPIGILVYPAKKLQINNHIYRSYENQLDQQNNTNANTHTTTL